MAGEQNSEGVCDTADVEPSGADSSSKCSPVPSVIKLGLVGVAVALFLINTLIYVSPSFAKQVGNFVPDSLAPKKAMLRNRLLEH